MNGIAKVIDELGLMIMAKNVELEQKQNEINKLRKKIETIEQYLDFYESCSNREKH